MLASPAMGALIFDGGDPGYAPAGSYMGGHNLTKSRVVAADFTIEVPATLTDIRFFTMEPDANAFDGGVAWYLFDDIGGNPPANDFEGFAHGRGLLRSRENNAYATGYTYDVSLDTPVTLESGKVYWLGLEANDSPFSTSLFWVPPVGWLDPPRISSYFGEDGRLSHTPHIASGWGQTGWDFSFKLFDNTATHSPEPATWLLLCMGLVTLLSRKRG
jgi:hypothetical protein